MPRSIALVRTLQDTSCSRLRRMDSASGQKQSLCFFCAEEIFGLSTWTNLWHPNLDADGELSYITRPMKLLESVRSRCPLCALISDRATAAGIGGELRLSVSFELPSDVRPSKINRLVLTIHPRSGVAGRNSVSRRAHKSRYDPTYAKNFELTF